MMEFNCGVADRQTAETNFFRKEVLTTVEAAEYLGLKKSYLYKLMMRRQIPYYKPTGKVCYFKYEDLLQWMLSNRVSTADEISQKAQSYCMAKGGAR